MKRQNRNMVILLVILSLLMLPSGVLANPETRLRLATENLNVMVGQEVTIPVLVENAPLIYGVESHLTFDPAVLEVTTLNHGTFLSADPATQAFILQNKADNKAGTIDYALVLLNPAPPVEGSGLLASITFRAKTAGSTVVEIKEAMFGTRTGEEIIPVVENAALTIAGIPPSQPMAEMTGAQESPKLELPTTTSERDNAAVNIEEIPGALDTFGPHPYHPSNETNGGNRLWLGLSILGLGVIMGFMGLAGLGGLMAGWFLITRTRRK